MAWTGCADEAPGDYTSCEPVQGEGAAVELSNATLEGVWANCFEPVDAIEPYCDVRADGTMRVVQPVVSPEARAGAEGSRYPDGTVLDWTYTVDSDGALTLYDERGVPDTELEAMVPLEMTDTTIDFGATTRWQRVQCTGPGFAEGP
jgi:hypothetical protein